MENPNRPVRIATAGESLIDLVDWGDGLLAPCEGGAVYNVTRALALQGLGTAYLNPLSEDAFGRRLALGLSKAGVQLGCPQPVAQPTALAVVGVDAQGQPKYSFYREGVADRAIDARALCAAVDALDQLEAVCTGCLALAPEDQQRYLPWLSACRDRGLAVVVDANLRLAAMSDVAAYRANVYAALALADVIKVSDEDLRALDPRQPDPLAAAQQLFALGPASFVALTLGSGGACLLARGARGWHARDRASLTVVDTVGAGDCFLAGLVGGLLAGGLRHGATRDLSDGTAMRALAQAVTSASHCVQRRGCTPPDRQELDALLEHGSVRVENLAR